MTQKKPILVVRRETLFRESNPFQGFLPHETFDYANLIINPRSGAHYLERDKVEQDPSWKQPIPYILVVNPSLEKIYAYQRAVKDAHYGEKRLQGKWSLGVGGHVEEIDHQTQDPLYECALREIAEEIQGLEPHDAPRLFGYINDDADAVGKVHFGLVYLLETSSSTVSPRDPEMLQGRLHTLEEFTTIFNSPEHQVEGWSRIAWPFVQQYFNELQK